jgi:hypothetical protein
MGFADDYVDVATRIKILLERYPTASITCSQPRVVNMGDRAFIEVQARVDCNDGSGRISEAAAWEPYPGRTNFTRDSEMMNAETSAVGRACGLLGIGLDRSVASLDEVRARRRETDDDAAAKYHSSPREAPSPARSPSEGRKPTAGPGPATEKQIGFLKRLCQERGIDLDGMDVDSLTAAEASDMIETAKATPKLK